MKEPPEENSLSEQTNRDISKMSYEELDEFFTELLKGSRKEVNKKILEFVYSNELKLQELEELGVSSYLINQGTYLCNVDGEWFYYYPSSGKWRAKGSTRIYNSGNAKSFVTIVREHRKAGSIFNRGTENLLTLRWDRVYTVKELIPLKRKAFSKYMVVLDDNSRCWSNYSFEKAIEKPGVQFLIAPCCALNTKKEFCSILLVSKKKTAKKTKKTNQ